MALLEAQSAVQLDNAFDIPAALDAYRRAVTLLSKVMDASSSPDEQERLRTIVGRLNNISPSSTMHCH
jgi:hypothetical protein